VGENWSGPISNCFWDKQTSGRHNGVGLNDGGAITNLLGKTTSQMRIQSTFSGSPAYWDFVGETANGTEDVWRMCVDGVNYPQLYWQFVNRRGDFVCPDGVDFADLAFFTKHWLQTGCTLPEYCNGADLDKSGIVNFSDFGLLAEHWLTE
jgi:hypothetical protein